MIGVHSEHFSEAELACRCCGVNRCTPALLEALEALRAIVKKPVIVDCAYRCEKHNAQVGGVRGSMHLEGKAADIRVSGWNAVALERAARQVPEIKGIGRDDHRDYIHIDVRPEAAQWCYDTSGKQCGYYKA